MILVLDLAAEAGVDKACAIMLRGGGGNTKIFIPCVIQYILSATFRDEQDFSTCHPPLK